MRTLAQLSTLLSIALLLGACSGSENSKRTGSAETGSSQPLTEIELVPLSINASGAMFQSVTLSADVATLPAEATVYSVVTPNVTTQSVEMEARKFDLHGKARYDGAFTVVHGKMASLAVDRATGSINWFAPGYEQAVSPLKNQLTDQDYIARARDFLKSKGHFTDGMIFSGIGSQQVDGRPDDN